MAKYYLSIVHDRHVDPAYRLFRDVEAAVRHTRNEFRKAISHPEYIIERSNPTWPPYIIWWSYDPAEDSAAVVELEAPDA